MGNIPLHRWQKGMDGWVCCMQGAELGAACLEEYWDEAARAKASCVYRNYINPGG